MINKNSSFDNDANYIYNLKSGHLFFHDDFIISEINEGVIVGKEDFLEIMDLVNKHYGNKKPYGLISHRLNSYSVNLSELLPIVSEFGSLIANAVVVYSNISLNNFELEKRILKLKGEVFFNMDQAIEWTKLEIQDAKKNHNKV